jgi:hypothetical protein
MSILSFLALCNYPNRKDKHKYAVFTFADTFHLNFTVMKINKINVHLC